jgi:type II secretory pathway predicted ATPase ExeA
MNYIAKFGMEFNPFIKNSKEIKIESLDYKQLIFRLHHLEEIKGVGLITGDPGLGKTTAIRFWTESLNKSQYKVIYITLSTITVMEFYKQLADELGLEPSASKRKNFKQIQEEIKRLSIEKRITPVIILDEANYLSSGIINDLKILLNFDMDSKDRFILLLVGQPSIRSLLGYKAQDALRQRISINYSFQHLDKNESRNYIDTKMKESGLNQCIISDEAYNQIINSGNGTPRMINQIMDKCLLILSNLKQDIITEDMTMEAINEVTI